VLTLHVGPQQTSVSLRVAGRAETLSLQPNETRAVRFALPAGAAVVPIAVQASAAFRPSEVDRSSTDRRQLGCQVRVELE